MALTTLFQTFLPTPSLSEVIAFLGMVVSVIKKKAIANKCDWILTRLGAVLYSCFRAFVVLCVMVGSSVSFSTVEVSVSLLNSSLDICKSVSKLAYAVFTGRFFKQDLKFLSLFVNSYKSVTATVKYLVYGIYEVAVEKINSFVHLSPILIQ